MGYTWPGNVRELKSALEYGFVINEGGLIDLNHLPPQIVHVAPDKNSHESEKEALIKALRQSGGNKSEAARILGVNRVTVWNRMKKYGIDLRKILVA